jgi:hypothetical protein
LPGGSRGLGDVYKRQGLTYCYSKFVIQVPLYYNSKTTINNGRWNVGIGLGMRLK